MGSRPCTCPFRGRYQAMMGGSSIKSTQLRLVPVGQQPKWVPQRMTQGEFEQSAFEKAAMEALKGKRVKENYVCGEPTNHTLFDDL